MVSLDKVKKTKSVMDRSRLDIPTKNQHIFVVKIVRKMVVASLSDFYYLCIVFAFQHYIDCVPRTSEIVNLIDRIVITNIIHKISSI